MDRVIDLRLRWVPVGTECVTPPVEVVPGISDHDLRNSITAISGAARLLHDRWDELDEVRRQELAAMILRRADELRLLMNHS